MAKILNFRFRGEYYQVNEKGEIKANGLKDFSKAWIFRGGLSHHWRNSVDVTLKDAFLNPKRLNNCLGADIDHGTYRVWGGSYLGNLPRISNAYVTELS